MAKFESCEYDCDLFYRNISCCLRGDCPRGYIIIDFEPDKLSEY
jgi:hypothetical protein